MRRRIQERPSGNPYHKISNFPSFHSSWFPAPNRGAPYITFTDVHSFLFFQVLRPPAVAWTQRLLIEMFQWVKRVTWRELSPPLELPQLREDFISEMRR